jgi:hypothetical protein
VPDPQPGPFQPGFAPECMACPIGLFFYGVKNTKPEVMEHLMKAAFELLQAFRSLAETYTARWEQAESVQRINID